MPAPQSWADDVDAANPEQTRTETTDENGITTITQIITNEEGKRVKVTRRIKRTLTKTKVNHLAAERMHWTKFGKEKGHKAGPDMGTTTVGENIRLKLQPGGVKKEESADEGNDIRKQLTGRKIQCRICQGDHYTTRCPYKDTLGDVVGGEGEDTPDAMGSGAATPTMGAGAGGAGTGPGGSKYVPIHMRAGASMRGDAMNMRPNRDEMPTLRVTNLSEDATEPDLWELFGRFGRIVRIYVGRDQFTGLCKGYAFVSFDSKAEAERAMGKINGLPYDHLILACAWSQPRQPDGAKPPPV